MNGSASPSISAARSASAVWATRLRLAAGVIVVWGFLHLAADRVILAQGPDRPRTLLLSEAGVLPGLVTAAILFILAGLLGRMIPRRDGAGTMLLFGLALALWATGGGTMDQWLILHHPQPGPGTAAPYLSLLADYAILALMCTGLAAWSGYGPSRGLEPARLLAEKVVPATARAALGLDASAQEVRSGLLGLLIGTAVAGVLLFILAGPPVEHTYRGQVFFSTAVACAAAVFVVRYVTHLHRPVWFWPVPILVGALGLLLAAWDPVLADPYQNINVIPAWRGLARPLPIEMVGVGIAATVFALRATEHMRMLRDGESEH
jgi:hypothetical protein